MADEKKKVELSSTNTAGEQPKPATKESGGASPSAPDDITTTVASQKQATDQNPVVTPEPSETTTAGDSSKKDGKNDVEFDYDELASDDDLERSNAIEKRMKPVPPGLQTEDGEVPAGWPFPEDRLSPVYPADQSTRPRASAEKEKAAAGAKKG